MYQPHGSLPRHRCRGLERFAFPPSLPQSPGDTLAIHAVRPGASNKLEPHPRGQKHGIWLDKAMNFMCLMRKRPKASAIKHPNQTNHSRSVLSKVLEILQCQAWSPNHNIAIQDRLSICRSGFSVCPRDSTKCQHLRQKASRDTHANRENFRALGISWFEIGFEKLPSP